MDLVLAARRGQYERVEEFIKTSGKNSDLNRVDAYGATPLMNAATNGHADVCQLLIDHGSDPNKRNDYNETPLMRAAENGSAETIVVLIEGGAETDLSEEKEDLTALMKASIKGNVEAARTLVCYGASVSMVSARKRTARMYAVDNEHGEVADFLEASELLLTSTLDKKPKRVRKTVQKRNAFVDTRDQLGNTPLILSARIGHDGLVNTLRILDANIEATNKDGDTALILASRFGHEKTVFMLLDHTLDNPADPNHANNRHGKMTPLMHAAKRGHAAVCQQLLDAKANHGARNLKGETALALASTYGHEDVVRLLLERGAKVEYASRLFESPVLRATTNSHPACMAVLLRAGADARRPDLRGYDVLKSAHKCSGAKEVIAVAEAHAAETKEQNEHKSRMWDRMLEKLGRVEVEAEKMKELARKEELARGKIEEEIRTMLEADGGSHPKPEKGEAGEDLVATGDDAPDAPDDGDSSEAYDPAQASKVLDLWAGPPS